MNKESILNKIKGFFTFKRSKRSEKKESEKKEGESIFSTWIFWKYLIANLGLALCLFSVVIFGTIYYLDNITNHNSKVTLPDFKGKNIEDVKSVLDSIGLRYQISDSIYDPKKPNGTVIVQSPLPSSKTLVSVKPDRVIFFRVSKKKKFVEMPDLQYKTKRFSKVILENRGLKVAFRQKPVDPIYGGVIVEQVYRGKPIEKGTKIPVGSTIFLYQGEPIIEPPVLMPNLYGHTIKSAKEILDNMGFRYVGVCSDCITSEDSLSARVFSQSPEYFRGRKIGTSRTISFSAKVAFVRDPNIPMSKIKKVIKSEDN